MFDKSFISSFIVPTGIGAGVGGFAGDASPYVNLFSKISPVITNPNVVNAALFSGINDNILYTEGYSIDNFFKGEIAICPSRFNKIGVVFDKAISQKMLNVHINTINAVKAVYGINIIGYEITREEVGVEFSVSQTGISTGNVSNPNTLIDATRNLLHKGAEAIAVVCLFDDEEDDDYANGIGVDPVGGVEAVISHILSKEFNIPVAHAPAFSEAELIISSEIVDKRASAEYITPTFLPCILKGLYNAPKIKAMDKSTQNDITIDDLNVLIMPYDCMGSLPVLKATERNIPIVAVKQNTSVLDVTADKLNINVIEASSYLESAGMVLAMKNGICL